MAKTCSVKNKPYQKTSNHEQGNGLPSPSMPFHKLARATIYLTDQFCYPARVENGFAGIEEKLKRADENIQNLKSEIARFFEKCKYPVMPKLNDERILEAIEYHKTLTIPLRFSVLAGETIHHLRSCLDHIVWEFSDDASRHSRDSRWIEFPILETRPSPEHKFTRYDRKIQGVRHLGVLKLIGELQPYNRVDPADDLLSIIQTMDITDKHRGLVLINSTGLTEGLPPHLAVQFMRHLYGTHGIRPFSPNLKRQIDQYSKTTPHVSFSNFGRRKIQSAIPGLTQLTSHVRSVVTRFSDFR